MEPELDPVRYAYGTLGGAEVPDPPEALLVFREREGTTVIVPRTQAADLSAAGSFACERITLQVPSDLAAVGFLAAVTTALAEAGIGVNAVSAFHHDHLFVPAGHGARALSVLRQLQDRYRDLP
jgi:hypothetical protein